MKLCRKLFGGLTLSWPVIIIGAVLAGVYTALMAILDVTHNTSFITITATFEVWIFFGILIIMNSKSNKESALKCFVFFLISQPLVYLVQVPFSQMGWGLFQYYGYWFAWTVFCLPMGYIGYFMKKDKWWGYLILFPMIAAVAYSYLAYLSEFQFAYPRYILICLFCIATLIMYPLCIFHSKKIQIVGLCISLFLIGLVTVIDLCNPPEYSTYIMFNNEENVFDDTYTVTLEDSRYGTVEINHFTEDDAYGIRSHFKHSGKTFLVLKSPSGETTKYSLTIWHYTYDLVKQ